LRERGVFAIFLSFQKQNTRRKTINILKTHTYTHTTQ
jgi:hypothetical protein